ncbi:MAG: hypothetical protein ACE5JH_04800 [Acidobacteriota bacterium]
MKANKALGFVVATAVVGMLAAGHQFAYGGKAEGEKTVKCYGINSCKGHGECGAPDGSHSCAGKNQCKGKGWVKVKSEKECKEKGGKVLKEEEE